MSETPEALRTLIDGANAAGPGPERLAAIRARLEAQLGPLDAPRAPVAPPPVPSAGPALGPKAVAGAVVVAAIALWLGTRSPGPEPQTHEPERASSELPVAAPTPIAPVHEVEPPPAVEPEPSAVAAPEAIEEAPARRAVRPATRETVEAPTPTTIDSASSLREEIALLDRALRAREAGDLAGARRALTEHRERFPSGTLGLERDRMAAELADEERAAPPP